MKTRKMREVHEEGRRRTNSELHFCQEELAVALGTEASKKEWPPGLVIRSLLDELWLLRHMEI